MFYSPNKEFVRFSTYRTSEIRALKDRIQKEKVTQEQIDSTQSRLARLKKEYEDLNNEKHPELKDVFNNSERAIADLLKQKNLSERESAMAKLQTQDVDRRRMDLQDRGSQLEEQLRGQISEKDDLVRRKEHLEEDILELDIAYQKAYGQMGKSADWKLEVGGGQDELKQKKRECEVNWKQCSDQKDNLSQESRKEQDSISQLDIQRFSAEKASEKQKMLIQQGKLSQGICLQKTTAFILAETTASSDDWVMTQAEQLQEQLNSILKSASEESSRVEKEEQTYERKISQVLSRVNEGEAKQVELEQKIAVVTANSKLLQDKNQTLRVKMNSIFKSDNELVSLICSKKAYPNASGEVCDIVKKSAFHSTKENAIALARKEDQSVAGVSLPAMKPQIFGEVNRVL